MNALQTSTQNRTLDIERRNAFPMPAIKGAIVRRILINYRCDPEALARLLPNPFRPKLVNGHGIAGICLIRLRHLRPVFLPAWTGLTSENAAHRIAVEWEDRQGKHEGVFIPRRDTDSLMNQLAGGRLFPGVHHAARFHTWETGDRYKIEIDSTDGEMHVRIAAHLTDQLPANSTFENFSRASEFFQAGSVGWSPGTRPGVFDGMELQCNTWAMTPLAVEYVTSSFFEDRILFPPNAAEFDSAFLMRNIDHAWKAQEKLVTTTR